MTKTKIFDLQNCEEISDDEAESINGGSKFSHWLHKHLGIPEIPITIQPTTQTPDPSGATPYPTTP